MEHVACTTRVSGLPLAVTGAQPAGRAPLDHASRCVGSTHDAAPTQAAATAAATPGAAQVAWGVNAPQVPEDAPNAA